MAQFNTHGGYFAPNGYFRVNEGGSHEENPNGGVQVGVDQQGVPNMLEEGEPVYNDYVYSDNITAEKNILEKHNIPAKYAGKLYSKIADAFVDEAEDRPNDPISNNGLNAMLVRLADAQEEQKAIAQQKELEEELANMSPEELDALEAMLAEQGAAEEQAMQEQAMAQQPMPEEQMMAAQHMQAPVQEVPPQQPMMAEGGKMRKFAPGGFLTDPPTSLLMMNDPIMYGTANHPVVVKKIADNDVRGAIETGKNLDKRGLEMLPVGDAIVDVSEGNYGKAAGNTALAFAPIGMLKGAWRYGKSGVQAMRRLEQIKKVEKNAKKAKKVSNTADKNKLLKEAYKRSAEAGKESGHFWTKDYWHRLPEHNIGEEIAANLLPGHNVWRHIRRANSLGKTGWNKAGRIGFALGEEGLRAKLGIGGYGLLRGPIASGVGDAYDYVSDNADYARNTVMPPAREVIDTGIDYSDHGDRDYALGGPMNKFLTGGPLEDLVKEYIQKTGNFPDPNQYAILQRLANLGTISNEDYASLNPKFANGLNPNKVRPAEEFGTVNKSISGRRIIPDVYNGGQLDSLVVRPRENDTIYNGGNLDSIFVRPAPDIYDGGNLDSIVVRPNVVPQIDTLLTSSAELNPITVSADKPSPEESYSSDYLWKNLGNGIGKKQRMVSKGIITVGGRPYDPVTRQFLDPNTYAGNGYYIPLSGNFRQEKSVSGATSSSATSTNSTPSGVVTENKKYGPEWWPASAKEASENALNNKIDALPSDKRNIENTYNRVMANYNAAHQNDEALPTWMRYAGIANALGDMAWNLAQKPDKYKIPYVNPVLPNGRMDFIDPVFNPVDENMAVSDLMASEAAAARGLGASGLGPSTGANLLALDYNAGRNMGNARTQVWDANNQRRNAIIAARNANAQALGQFRYGISRDRAGILNNFAMQNLHNRLLQQRLNNAAEQEKWNAFSQSKNPFAKGLSDIGYENANRNMINLNEVIDYLIGNGFDVQYKGNRACGGTLLRKYKK